MIHDSVIGCVFHPGGHAAEPGQGDDDCHQWSGGLWQAKIKTRDPVVPECPPGAALRTQSAQRHGKKRWRNALMRERSNVKAYKSTQSHIKKKTLLLYVG